MAQALRMNQKYSGTTKCLQGGGMDRQNKVIFLRLKRLDELLCTDQDREKGAGPPKDWPHTAVSKHPQQSLWLVTGDCGLPPLTNSKLYPPLLSHSSLPHTHGCCRSSTACPAKARSNSNSSSN
eukprot:1160352-Pelagomonas_calceolata.AAC.3